MPVLDSDFTAHEIAEALGIDERRATALADRFRRQMGLLMGQLTGSGRPDHKTTSAVAFSRIAGGLYAFDAGRFTRWMRRIAEEAVTELATTGVCQRCGPRAKETCNE